MSHANAVLTPRTRLRLARLVVHEKWAYATAAKMFMVSPRTAKKWADRYRAEGPTGMADRSSRPHTSPAKTSPALVRRIVTLRWRHRLGPVQIAGRLGVPASTVHAVLVRCRINRLGSIDRVTGEPLRRYEHAHPGSLLHVDVTKFGNIPDGGGWRYVGMQQGKRNRAATDDQRRKGQVRGPLVGTAYVHTVIDDHSRVAYASDPHRREGRHGDRGAAPGHRMVRRPGRHRSASTLRQRVLLPLLRLGPGLHRAGHHAQADPALPAPNQRQDRTVPPHPR